MLRSQDNVVHLLTTHPIDASELCRAPFLSKRQVLLIGTLLSIASFTMIAGCTVVDDPGKDEMNFLSFPKGSIPPEGVSRITKGMQQTEVLEILEPLYAVQHAADAKPGSPLVDYFTYREGGQVKYVEIFYERDRVLDIRFGFTSLFVML